MSKLSTCDRKTLVLSFEQSDPFIDTLVHDRRFQTNELVARAGDLVFVYDINLKKLTDCFVISAATESRWPLRGHLRNLTAWPQCDRTRFSDAINILKAHVHVFCRKACHIYL